MTDFTYPEYQRHDKKIAALEAAIRADEFFFEGNALWHPFWSAEGNANDTVYVEMAQPESELPNLFWGSLSTFLSDMNDKDVLGWYIKHGVSF
jgi:hypothetical protein